MPSPRPRAVVRLVAVSATSVTLPRRESWANEPMTAMTAMANGSRAATTLPKTNRSSTRVSGMAMVSARTRSSTTCFDRSWPTAAPPPAWTVSAPLWVPV